MADKLPPLTGNIDKDLPPLTGDFNKDMGIATPMNPNPYAGPIPQGTDDPGKLGRILRIANEVSDKGNPGNERLLGIPLQPMSAEAKIGLVTPPGAGTLIGRIGVAGAAQGAGALARGEGLQGAAQGVLKGAAAQGVGEAIGAGVRGVRTMLPVGARGLAKYAADREGALASEMKQSVPPMKDAKSLRDMFYSQDAADKLHQFYDDSLKAVIERGKGQMIQVPEEAAKAFKLGGTGGFQFPAHLAQRMGGNPLAQGPGQGMVNVDAGEAAKAITGKWKTNKDAYRAIADVLDEAGISDPVARAAYKTYMGFKGLVGEMPGNKLDLVKVHERLNQPGPSGELLKRSMADKAASILNPTGKPIEQGNMRIPGAIVGGTLGSMLPGLGLYGHGAGMASGAWLGSHIGRGIPQYYNVPRTPINPDVSMLLQQYLQGALQQNLSSARP